MWKDLFDLDVRVPNHTMLARRSDSFGLPNLDNAGKLPSLAGLERTALLAAMDETSFDAIITINSKGIVQSFNPAAERLFGYSQSEVRGRNVKMLMPTHFSLEHDQYLSNYLATGERRIIGVGRVVSGEKKDGSAFTLELSVGETRIAGEPIFVGFIRDLTAIQREQRRVEELQRDLFHVSRLGEMGQVASGLAHEVNQPLAAVMNYIQVAQQMTDADTPVSGVLEKAEAQMRRAADIVKRLRGFIDRRETERRPENLATVVEEALALGLVGPAAQATRVRLALDRELRAVDIDRIQIQQVIVNLLRNAVDAMKLEATRELTVSARAEGADAVRVSVSDKGPGVSPQIADKLFGSFVTTKEEGMGVGLSICKAIIEAHGGRIWFESNESGRGTTFQFTIPVAKAAGAK